MFQKISGVEIFQAKEGGSFTFLSKFFLFHRTEKTSPGNHSVFQKNSGGEIFLWIRGGVGLTIFRRKVLSHSTETKNFEEEPFCFLESFGYQKILCLRGKYHGYR